MLNNQQLHYLAYMHYIAVIKPTVVFRVETPLTDIELHMVQEGVIKVSDGSVRVTNHWVTRVDLEVTELGKQLLEEITDRAIALISLQLGDAVLALEFSSEITVADLPEFFAHENVLVRHTAERVYYKLVGD